MDDKIKTAFDGIRAEGKLKSDTALYLRKEIARRTKSRARVRYAAAFASFVVLFVSGLSAHRLYFTPAAYVDVDVNPSVELTINRFDRVIGSHAYNDGGSDIIDRIPLTHKSYARALVMLMEVMTERGYLQDDALVSVTLQTDDKAKENTLLDNIQTGIESYMAGYHRTAELDVFIVSSDTRSHSHEQGMSPAKYLAIQELIKVDPEASIESCRGHSLSEIKQLAQGHGHSADTPAADYGGNTPHPSREKGHHGGGH